METQKTSSRKSKQPVKRPLGILHPPKTKGTRTTWHRKSMEQRRRFTPRARALMEESECQELINLYKSKFPIMELLIEVLLDCCKDRIRLWQSKAVECLYEVSEIVLNLIFRKAYVSSLLDKRDTISVEDIKFVGRSHGITK
ncbi:histone H3-like centromeric protein A [Hyla sarda]|uniref:histone H3-like centromeric protein A n=1 Tax=Hyla sarda TaxID=327740 RepID=UPI0024C44EDA|nr:histone H3-like centromeric protein A [Hyla sarda]